MKRLGLLILVALTQMPTWGSEPPKNCASQLTSTDKVFDSGLTLGAYRYDQWSTEQFEPALERGLEQAQANLKVLAENPEKPTFENTILALEHFADPLDYVGTLFGVYLGIQISPEIYKIAESYLPKSAELNMSVVLNDKIFQRVRELYEKRESLALSPVQNLLLEKTYNDFVRLGATLPPEQKRRLQQISQRMAELTESFKANTVKATNEFHLLVTDRESLKGLPESHLQVAERKASARGETGYALTLDHQSYAEVMQFLDNRELREKMWRAFMARATEGETNNQPILLEIARLRQENAKILGYAHHADLTTADRMAENLSNVDNFLDRLAEVYKTHALKEFNELEAFAGRKLKPWDQAFYAEKLLHEKYGLDSEKLRAYFPLEQVIDGAFYVAHRLYGITFEARPDLPTWDKNVRVFEVKDRDGSALALFYLDPYSRPSKSAGAWATHLRNPGEFDGHMRRPHILNVLNITEPLPGEPALLDMDQVRTLFHELGHGLHGILTKVAYPSISGMCTAWDCIELPSQLNENWAFQPEVLRVYARHYQTGELLPEDMVKKALEAQNFRSASVGLNQISIAKLDLAWHGRDFTHWVDGPQDVQIYEGLVREQFEILPPGASNRSATFAHIFSGGYSAGYYSYKWAEVLAADAFSVFEEKGLFDPETAGKFREFILERGGSEKPADLYRKFRGRDPDPDSLLRAEGFLK